jgi:hypothetical protein
MTMPGVGDDNDTEHGGNAANTSQKIEFLKLDSVRHLMPWLNRCERYFRLRGTPELRRVEVASFYLLDNAQVWYHRVELNDGPPYFFVQLVNTRFDQPLTKSPIGELALLHRDGSIDEYCNKFMALSCRNPATTEEHQVQLFTAGLGHHLQTDVAL